MCVSSERRAPRRAVRADRRGAAVLPGEAWLAPGTQTSLPYVHCPREVSSSVHFLQRLHSVFAKKWGKKSFSRLKKKKKRPKNSQDKNPPGCCLFLFVDKLTTEMQTAGTSKALGNQQLQKAQRFLQSLAKRRGEAGRREVWHQEGKQSQSDRRT